MFSWLRIQLTTASFTTGLILLRPFHCRLRITDHFAFRDAPLDTNSSLRFWLARFSLPLPHPDLQDKPNKFKVVDAGGAFTSTCIAWLNFTETKWLN